MYKIGEAAKILKVGVHTLRFWESQFPHIISERKGIIRYYNSIAMTEFEKIKRMMHGYGMDIQGVKNMVKSGGINSNVRKVRGTIINPKDVKANNNVTTIKKEINGIIADLENILSDIAR